MSINKVILSGKVIGKQGQAFSLELTNFTKDGQGGFDTHTQTVPVYSSPWLTRQVEKLQDGHLIALEGKLAEAPNQSLYVEAERIDRLGRARTDNQGGGPFGQIAAQGPPQQQPPQQAPVPPQPPPPGHNLPPAAGPLQPPQERPSDDIPF